MITRRTLLGASMSLMGGAITLGTAGLVRPPGPRAQQTPDRAFIFCYFDGGWDLLLSLDPRDPAVFRDDLRRATRISTGFDLLVPSRRRLVPTSVDGMVFGPYIGDLARHADKLCVVRGMSMDTLTHEVGRRRFLTGHAPAGLQARGSSASTVLATVLGQAQPIPQLSVNVESYNADQPPWASAIRVTSVEDLVRALRPSPLASPADQQVLLDGLVEELMDCPAALASPYHQRARASRLDAQDLVALGLDSLFDFGARTPAMDALRALYGIDPTDLSGPAAQAAAAVTAITSGISRSVCIQAAVGLDTHGPEWASAHGPALERGFDIVAAMIDDLASRPYGTGGESWLDHTTLVCFSEFGRSTLVNSSGGRDHFLHNACVLVGGGVRGGQVIGRTSDLGMAPVATDLATGQPDPEGGEVVYPEHVYRALLTGLGVEEDIAGWDAPPLEAIFG